MRLSEHFRKYDFKLEYDSLRDFKFSIVSELGKIFGARLVRVWNFLPSPGVEAASVEVFKSRLDSIVFEDLFSFDLAGFVVIHKVNVR